MSPGAERGEDCQQSNSEREGQQRVLYEICKDIFTQQWKSIGELDDKAKIYLTIIGFLFAAIGFVFSQIEKAILAWSTISYIILLLAIFVVISMMISLLLISLSVLLKPLKTYPNPEELATKLGSENVAKMYLSMSNHFKKIFNSNQKSINRKILLLKIGSYCVLASSLLFFLLLTSIIYANATKLP